MRPIKRFHDWIDRIWREDRYSAAFERRRFLPWKLETIWIAVAGSGYLISELITWIDPHGNRLPYSVCVGSLLFGIAMRMYFLFRFFYFFSFTKNSEEIMKMRREDSGDDWPT